MKTRIQLPLQTFNFVAGFMIWVILSGLMPFIKQDIHLTASQVAWVTAIPVLLGSVLRVPLGYWANRYGARAVFTVSLLVLMAPVFAISVAKSFPALIVDGFFLGIAGAVFSVGVTSLPKYYPRERHGFINGVYGMGNIGTAVTTFFAPVVANHIGWQSTVRLYLVLLAAFALINYSLGDRKESRVRTALTEQVRSVWKNEKLWVFSLFYFITFGSFVAFTVYLPNFLVASFHLAKVDAGFRTAGFIVLATLLRPVGGWMSDKWNPYKVLMFVFSGMAVAGIVLSFPPTLGQYTFGCLLVAFCAGVGNGAVFKLVPLHFQKQAGIANGVVAMMGGLGGFFPPLILTILYNITGHYAIGFMLLSEFAFGSFVLVVWMFFQGRLQIADRILQSTAEGIMVTDTRGVIRTVNPAFTALTGYRKEDVVGKRPSVLKSGMQDKAFYDGMWESVRNEGHWRGQIWNRRKNGEIYLEWLTITAIRDDAGTVRLYAGMFSDITQLHAGVENQ